MNALADYVQRRIEAGASKAEISEELETLGWSDEETDAAYRDALIGLGAPLPDRPGRPTSRKKPPTTDIVFNFFSFILLCIVTTAIGILYFQIVDLTFPDPLLSIRGEGRRIAAGSIHHAIASLVVAFPLYIAILWLWFRGFRRDSARVESKLTKWLTYVVLLIASTVVVGDLITILFKLLQGEFTVRFLLKAIILLVIAGLILGFYFMERREIQYHRPVSAAVFRYLGGFATALVSIGIISGFIVAGTPATARKQAFDHERERTLGLLAGCVERYAAEYNELPTTFDSFQRDSAYASCTQWERDPETREQYGYRVITPSAKHGDSLVGEFELCATFSLASQGPKNPIGSLDRQSTTWYAHGAGHVCHTLTAHLKKPAPRQ